MLQNAAQAVFLNEMQATASQNTIVIADQTTTISNSIPVSVSVSPVGGSASASALVSWLNVAADSKDNQSLHMNSGAVQYSSFHFWNTFTNIAYSAADLAGTDLILDFTLKGWATMPTIGNARFTGYSFNTQLYICVGFDAIAGDSSLACGPVGPCSVVAHGSPTLNTGDNSIFRNFSLSESITADNGKLFSQLFLADGGGTASALSLNLNGLRYSGSKALNFGIKFNDGSILKVHPVPLPGAALMLLSGLSLLGLHIHRRSAATI